MYSSKILGIIFVEKIERNVYVNQQNFVSDIQLLLEQHETYECQLHKKLHRAQIIEIIDIECGLLSRVSQKIVATKWRKLAKFARPRTFCAKANGNF